MMCDKCRNQFADNKRRIIQRDIDCEDFNLRKDLIEMLPDNESLKLQVRKIMNQCYSCGNRFYDDIISTDFSDLFNKRLEDMRKILVEYKVCIDFNAVKNILHRIHILGKLSKFY